MRKVIVVLLLLSIIIAGCTPAVQTTPEEKTDAQVKAEDNEKNAVVEIEFWHGLGGKLGEAVQAIVDEFNASQEKYVVKAVVLGSYEEIDQNLQAAYAAQKLPALVVGGSEHVFQQKGLVEPFEDFMPDDYDKDDIVKGFMKAAVIDGKMYFAPAYGTSQLLYFNKAILRETGKDVTDLKTWQSIAGLSDDVIGLSTNVNTIEHVWQPMWGSGNIADMASSNGGRFISEDGKTVTINTDPWVEVLEQVRKWIHEDEIMRIHFGGQGWEYWYKTMDDWVYGKTLGYTGSPGDYKIALEAVKKAIEEGYKNEFAVTHQPGWGANDPAPYFGGLMYFIPKGQNLTRDQKIGAAEFVTFATNTANTARFSMLTGYVPVRNSVLELPEYIEFLKENPDADAALIQIDKYAIPFFIDPTGGAILQALSDAVDQVQIENKPAREALDKAAKEAQRELDKANKNQ
ncbi:MAG: ABC transporter substrate-binding protein [Clostridiales bacterium]|nr:ABC transporter substrate-binding protein [Clostridiales bacterium]